VSQSSLVNTPRDSEGEEARRSTRLERSVPLIIFGQNRVGEPFVERTVSTSLNLHGCRYPSRHEYGVGSWITLQVVGLNVEPKPPAVRARVRSVHVSQSPRELQQVGVELENPANVWGVITPPEDWLRASKTGAPVAQFTLAATPDPLEDLPVDMNLNETPEKPEHKMAEVATFPWPSPAAAKSPGPVEAEPPQPKRVLITPDGLINALQGRLHRAAEAAAQAAVAKEVDEAVRRALSSIDNVRESSVREILELFPARVENMRVGPKEALVGEIAAQWKQQMEEYRAGMDEMAERLEKRASELRSELARSQEFVEKITREVAPQIQAKLSEAVTRAASEFEGAASRTVDRRFERLLENAQTVTQEALLKLDARSAEVQALMQSAINSAIGTFQRQAESHVGMTLSEAKERAVSALSSLEAESRAACEARRQALEAEVARSAERSTEQFRKGMKAFLYSCLVAAVSAVDEHSKSTLEGLLKHNGETQFESDSDSTTKEENGILPDPDIDSLTH
jgi:hypothetical protein